MGDFEDLNIYGIDAIEDTAVNTEQMSEYSAGAGLEMLDNKIHIFFRHEKKCKFTYVTGLENVLDMDILKKHLNISNIDEIIRQIKKKLCTASKEEEMENGTKAYGFRGNHIDKLKLILVNDYGIAIKKITC